MMLLANSGQAASAAVGVSGGKTSAALRLPVRKRGAAHFAVGETGSRQSSGVASVPACSLYEAFEPAEAKRLADKLEIHYTPKHGSWLNMAEIELSVLNGQCLDRRIADEVSLKAEITAWNRDRNAAATTIDWRFTTADARIKLKHLYPAIHP